jgi:micrococcal nuclease
MSQMKNKKKKAKKSLLGTIGTLIIIALYIWLEISSPQEEIVVENREKVELVRVVDGDTIIVNYQNQQTRVRLIGINSPESVHEDESKNTQEGRDASAFLKEYLAEVDYVWLEFDVEPKDQYERVLAYVWMSGDGVDVAEDMLNGIIVSRGYADARSYKPNVKYQDALENVEKSR